MKRSRVKHVDAVALDSLDLALDRRRDFLAGHDQRHARWIRNDEILGTGEPGNQARAGRQFGKSVDDGLGRGAVDSDMEIEQKRVLGDAVDVDAKVGEQYFLDVAGWHAEAVDIDRDLGRIGMRERKRCR